MDNFKMYAEYADGYSFTTIDRNESYCMSNIGEQVKVHGECTYWTSCNGYDEVEDCYYVEGERFSDYDEEKQEYIK